MEKLIVEKAVKNLSSKKSIVNNITIKPSISMVKAKIKKEFEEAIHHRRSVRIYDPEKPIDSKIVKKSYYFHSFCLW